ncbi:MAG: VOC family protein [Actinomycetota bacterium]
MAQLRSVHPVLNVRNVPRSMAWYTEHLGFRALFADDGPDPNYGGIGRDHVELHLQWHSEQEWADGVDGSAYRFLVDDPDELFAEISAASSILDGKTVADTDWGTREFGVYDPDGNALFFYRDR